MHQRRIKNTLGV